MCSEFREVLEGIENEGDILVIEFRFMSICNGDLDEVGILMLACLGIWYLGVVGVMEMAIIG